MNGGPGRRRKGTTSVVDGKGYASGISGGV